MAIKQYPKWVYHKEHKAKIVNDQAEHEALAEGWVDSPADIEKVSIEVLPEEIEKNEVEGSDLELVTEVSEKPKKKAKRS